MQSCKLDACARSGKEDAQVDAVCGLAAALADTCRRYGHVVDWRRPDLCGEFIHPPYCTCRPLDFFCKSMLTGTINNHRATPCIQAG